MMHGQKKHQVIIFIDCDW